MGINNKDGEGPMDSEARKTLLSVEQLSDRARTIDNNVRDFAACASAARARSAELRARLRGDPAQRPNDTAARDVFLATVSHELRAPLTAILGWAHLLRSDQLDEATRAQALETIERNARAQAKLIADLLEASRIIAGKVRLIRAPVDLQGILRKAIDSLRLAANEKSLLVVLQSERCDVSGDADRLEQVILNLLSNAIKFTPAGGHVNIILENAGDIARVVVKDSGKGIKRELLPHVFDRFRQAEDSVASASAGLGLGLGIVRHLVELHDGRVDVESDGPGRGATFTVSLPLVHATATECEPRPKAAEPKPSDVRGIRVLVVDGEADTLTLLRTLLERRGAEVATASSADEALTLIESFRPDVLVADGGISNESSGSLIQRLRRGGGSLSDLPAIALTTPAGPGDSERPPLAGFQRLVAKPIEPLELLRAIASAARERIP